MTKGEKRALLIVLIIVLVGGSVWLYVRARQQEAKEEWMENWRQGKKKEQLLRKFGYSLLASDYEESDYDEKYYEKFLEDPLLPIILDYTYEFIERYYPNVGCRKFTVEDLEKDGIQVEAELEEVGDRIKDQKVQRKKAGGVNEDSELEKSGDYMEEYRETIYGVLGRARLYGRRKYIMTEFGYPEMAEAYGEENNTYDKVFLKEENLKGFLKAFDEEIRERYPNLKRGEITFEDVAGTKYRNEKGGVRATSDDSWNVCAPILAGYNADGIPVREIAEEIHARMGD